MSSSNPPKPPPAPSSSRPVVGKYLPPSRPSLPVSSSRLGATYQNQPKAPIIHTTPTPRPPSEHAGHRPSTLASPPSSAIFGAKHHKLLQQIKTETSQVAGAQVWNEFGFMDETLGACRSVAAYERLAKLGEGTYGVVYEAREIATGQTVALKKVRMEKEKDGLPITTLREIKVLKSVSHPNIVKLREIVVGTKPDNIVLVFEYVEHDLAALLDNMRSPFSEAEMKCLVQQLLRAVAYLHERFIIHRDLKLSNLLMNNRGQLKLADYGLARCYGEPVQAYTPKVVTLWYRAPELLLGATKYTTAIDMWGVGCIMGELMNKGPLMPGNTELEQLQCIVKLLGAPNDKIWPSFSSLPYAKDISLIGQPYNNLSHRLRPLSSSGLDLLNRLLTYDPEKRITANQALEHSYWKTSPIPTKEALMPTHPISYRYKSGQILDQDRKRRLDEATDDSMRMMKPRTEGPARPPA